MKLMKISVVSAFALGLMQAGLSAADPQPTAADPTKMTYIDSASVSTTPDPNGAVYTFVDSAAPEAAAIAQFGYKTIDRIGGMLVTEITRELATKETSEVVAVMHLKDLSLPKPVAGQPKITAIKRTSLMLRDPRNAPDGADMAALNRIHAELMADQTPDKMLVQKIELPGKQVEWRVYRPIAASQSCLSCHGDPKTFRPGVKDALDRLYPEDKAINYGAQEYRGVLRVSIEPAAAVSAKK
jgi:hypothetical protein